MAQGDRPPQPRHDAAADVGAWDIVAYLLSGIVVWGGAGWLLDWWLGTSFLVAVGILLGGGLSTYAVYRRYGSFDPPASSDGTTGESDGLTR
jgi:F0F1-type ATP synthase assembly protein I